MEEKIKEINNKLVSFLESDGFKRKDDYFQKNGTTIYARFSEEEDVWHVFYDAKEVFDECRKEGESKADFFKRIGIYDLLIDISSENRNLLNKVLDWFESNGMAQVERAEDEFDTCRISFNEFLGHALTSSSTVYVMDNRGSFMRAIGCVAAMIDMGYTEFCRNVLGGSTKSIEPPKTEEYATQNKGLTSDIEKEINRQIDAVLSMVYIPCPECRFTKGYNCTSCANSGKINAFDFLRK